jgi:hypothetical protein
MLSSYRFTSRSSRGHDRLEGRVGRQHSDFIAR